MTDREGVLDIFTAGATREGIAACAGVFCDSTGVALDIATNHGHLIRERILAGETDADVVMLPVAWIDELAGQGLASPDIQASLGVIGVGVAVRDGVAVPDVSSLAALKQSLLDADSIVITEAPSGVHLEAVFETLGLTAALADKITRYDTGTMVNEHLVAGTSPGEIGFGVTTEIMFFRDRGVRPGGPIPDEVQMAVDYRAALLTRSDKVDEARILMAFLATPEARVAFAATGVQTA